MASTESDGAVNPRIVRGRVDSLSLYEITEYELQTLDEGSPASTQLNFAIFFVSIAASFLAALLTTHPASDRVFLVFVVVVVAGFSLGGVLLALWLQSRRRVTKVVQKIKERCVVAQGSEARTAVSTRTEGTGSSAG